MAGLVPAFSFVQAQHSCVCYRRVSRIAELSEVVFFDALNVFSGSLSVYVPCCVWRACGTCKDARMCAHQREISLSKTPADIGKHRVFSGLAANAQIRAICVRKPGALEAFLYPPLEEIDIRDIVIRWYVVHE